MDTEKKGQLIGAIMSALRFIAGQQGKAFDEGDVFFALCFKSDKELLKIAKAAGI
jgi:hypothetical protein